MPATPDAPVTGTPDAPAAGTPDAPAAGDPFDHPTLRQYTPSQFGLAFGVGTYAAVGIGVESSTDAGAWTQRTSPTDQPLYAVTYGGGKFVAVGFGGVVIASADGQTWSEAATGVAPYLEGVAYIGGAYYAVGSTAIARSDDAIHWDVTTVAGKTFNAIAQGAGVLVAAGGGVAYSSPDGGQWTPVAGYPNEGAHALLFAGNQFVAVTDNGHVLTSPDSAAWTTHTTDTSDRLDGVAYGNGVYVAVGYGGIILSSADGAAWTTRRAKLTPTRELDSVVFDGARFVATGQRGEVVTSPDGVDWTVRRLGDVTMSQVVPWNGGFLAVGADGVVFHSADGSAWSAAAPLADTYDLGGVAQGAGAWVAVGAGTASRGLMWSSPDGTDWTLRGTPDAMVRAVVRGDDRFVAVGENGQTFTSVDGLAWEPHDSGTTQVINAVAFGGGVYVAAASDGTIYTSPDGAAWTPRESHSTAYLFRAIYAGGQFVVAGYQATLLTSPDGTTWTPQTVPTTDILVSLGYGDGTYVAGSRGGFFTSPDAVSWTAHPMSYPTIWGVAWNAGTWALVGNGGLVLTVAP